MNKKIYATLAALVLLLMAVAIYAGGVSARINSPATAQAKALTTSAQPTTLALEPLTMLPASDAVVTLDVKRTLNEALPRAFSGNQPRLDQVNADIDRFKTRTGINLRSFDRIAVGARFSDPMTEEAQRKSAETGQGAVLVAGKTTRTDLVAIAHGTFNSGAIVAAGRLAAKGKYQEEKYQGKTIYIFNLNERMKVLGLINMHISELAVSALDANTLAIGKPALVRAAIDSSAGRGARVSNELVQMASGNPNAMMAFAANVPRSIMSDIGLLGVDNDEITKSVASIRQTYGSLGMTANGFDLQTVVRTENADQARSLSDTVSAAKELAGAFASQMSGSDDKGRLVKNALESLKVTTQGNEIQIRMELAQADITTLVRGL
jgi:hypothetical protein